MVQSRSMPAPSTAVAVLDDLFFTAKIRESARILGFELTVVREPAVLHQGPLPAVLLLDLNSRKVDPFAALEVVRNRTDGGKDVPAVAFAASIDRALTERARDAGFDGILDREKLMERLPEILRSAPNGAPAVRALEVVRGGRE